MNRRLLRILLLVLVGLALTALATADDFYGVDFQGQNLMRIDLGAQTVTPVGSMSLPGNEDFQGLVYGASGELYGMTSLYQGGKVYTVDPSTAVPTLFDTPTPAPWGVGGFDRDPATGLYYYTSLDYFTFKQHLYTYDHLTGTSTSLGQLHGLLIFFGLAFASDGDLYTTEPSTNALFRVDKTNTAPPALVGTGFGPAVDIANGAALSTDWKTGDLIGWATTSSNFFRVDTTTGVGIPLFTSLTPDIVGFAGPPCLGNAKMYGTGCAGTGGFVPKFEPLTCPEVGAPFLLNIRDGLGGAPALLVFGIIPGVTPIGAGCDLLVSPLLAPMLPLVIGGTGPGAGFLTFGGPMPASAKGFTFTTQAFVGDSASPLGFTVTNGVEVVVP